VGNAHGREGRANEPPVNVRPAPRFLQDLKYLSQLMDAEMPLRQLYQAKHSAALFIIGDASSKAKGAVVVSQYGLDYELGVWAEQWRGKSSNVREAKNLTDCLERLAAESVKLAAQVAKQLETLNADNALADHKVFVLTDNLEFEGSYYKGHSTSRELSNIVFHLYKAQRAGGFILHVLHILGKRMKATGLDGLSRGDHTEGMMAGKDQCPSYRFTWGQTPSHRAGWESGSAVGVGQATRLRARNKNEAGVGSLCRRSTKTTCSSLRM
jgi:hypothetical protein